MVPHSSAFKDLSQKHFLPKIIFSFAGQPKLTVRIAVLSRTKKPRGVRPTFRVILSKKKFNYNIFVIWKFTKLYVRSDFITCEI